MAGNVIANYDRMSAKQITQTVAIGVGIQAVTAACRSYPLVGIAVAGVSQGINVFCILSSEQLSKKEKAADLLRTAVQTTATQAACGGGATLGAEIGVVGGPPGILVGGFLGALIGGIGAGLLGRVIERSPLKLTAYKSDWRAPSCDLENLFDKA
jgi:hypothetical protein